MRRREFITLIGGAATAFPFAARSQGTAQRLRRIGALVGTSPYPKLYAAFEQELNDRGWRIGENIMIEYRFAEGHLERLPALAAELVDHKVELIFAVTAPETRAAKAATSTIPIVFAAHGDPVESGDVLSFAHPGGNATGLSQMHPELGRKQLEFLKACVPNARGSPYCGIRPTL